MMIAVRLGGGQNELIACKSNRLLQKYERIANELVAQLALAKAFKT